MKEKRMSPKLIFSSAADELDNDMHFFLIKTIYVYTEEKTKDGDPEYPHKRHIKKFYDSTPIIFFPKSIDDILEIKNPYGDFDCNYKIEIYYEILASRISEDGVFSFFRSIIDKKTKKQFIKNFDDLFTPSENQLENWDNFIYPPPNKLSTNLQRLLDQGKERFEENYCHIQKAYEASERERNES